MTCEIHNADVAEVLTNALIIWSGGHWSNLYLKAFLLVKKKRHSFFLLFHEGIVFWNVI